MKNPLHIRSTDSDAYLCIAFGEVSWSTDINLATAFNGYGAACAFAVAHLTASEGYWLNEVIA